MSLTGDFARLERLAAKLGTTVHLVTEAAGELSKVVLDEYQRDFAGQHGPGGEPWAPSPHSMALSGSLANPSIHVSGTSVVLKTDSYGRFHQGGWQTGGSRGKVAVSVNISTRKEKTKTMRIGGGGGGPSRPIVPPGSDASGWEHPLEAATEKIVLKFFDG